MTKITSLFIAGAIFILWALVASGAFASEPSRMQEQMFGMTAQLNENCSATLIWSDRDDKSGKVTTLFLTAKHCVEGASERDMIVDVPVYHDNRIVKKDRFIARVKGQYYKGDLALIELKDRQTFFEKVAKIAPADVTLSMGEDVWTVGYPLGMALTVTPGLFGSLETVDYPSDGMEYFRATPSIAPGNSGGALYHMNAAGDYELLGVTTAGIMAFPWIALYTPLGDIHAYLKVAVPEMYPKEAKGGT